MNASPNLDAALTVAWAKSALDTAVGAALARVGLSLDDLRRLRIIGAHPQGLTREDLAEAMGETRSQTIRSSGPLVKLGWLSRAESGEFSLTDSGRHLIDQAEGISEKAAAHWFTANSIDPDTLTRIR
ncbi:DNA-binding MarR family transcriptional regulator [Brevibacterium epidermidis]|uniref:DNA-binding MarR family transcriptional regulator n=1 Tax=Brevibacterium epidermidis TaxID=1698 RepID=A0ABV4EH72_BREEP